MHFILFIAHWCVKIFYKRSRGCVIILNFIIAAFLVLFSINGVGSAAEEVDIFEITSSPTILIFDSQGEEVGRIKTRPKMTPTLEQEIVKVIEDAKS